MNLINSEIKFFLEDVFFGEADSNTGFPTNTSGGGGAAPGVPTSGVAGSMASFALVDCFLYVIDNQFEVDIFDVENGTEPNMVNTFWVEWGIETLFPHGDRLFIGAEAGMFIYDITNAANPSYLSEFRHARACDPVYVKGDHAFVTLRDGNFCQGFENQMDVVDISNITNPFLVKSYPMDNPHGLTIRNDELYLCDGASGLKVYDITDVESIDRNNLDHVSDFDAYDAIAIPGKEVVMVIGKDGFYQFDISDPEKLEQISLISVDRP